MDREMRLGRSRYALCGILRVMVKKLQTGYHLQAAAGNKLIGGHKILLPPTVSISPHERRLPSREVAYAYTAAMAFAQRFEVNLRAILYAADYHGWIVLELTEEERERFKDTEALIDRGTCGKLVEALERADWIPSKAIFKQFRRAVEHRNRLAHSYLTELPIGGLTKTKEKEIVHALYRMTGDLYAALTFTDALLLKSTAQADKEHIALEEFSKQVGMNYENPNRHFATRVKSKKK